MKKIKNLFVVVMMLITTIIVTSINAYADTAEFMYASSKKIVVNGIKYRLDGDIAVVYECVKETPNIVIPSEVTYGGKKYIVVKIGGCAFDNEVNMNIIETIVLPNTIREIGNFAFRGNKNLRSINIPNGVFSIGGSAFENCESLEEVILPSSVELIFREAFRNCKKLKTITIPKSVRKIGCFVFEKCESLKQVVVENQETKIYPNAFFGCPNLERTGGTVEKFNTMD